MNSFVSLRGAWLGVAILQLAEQFSHRVSSLTHAAADLLSMENDRVITRRTSHTPFFAAPEKFAITLLELVRSAKGEKQ